MTTEELKQLSDDALVAETTRVAQVERRSMAELLALLIEVERRGLHLALGHSSLFIYCVRTLHFSEQAAYSRITAARAARRIPALLTLLADGALTLSSVGLLAPHLTDENVEPLLEAARHKSTRDVERLIACLHPQPDIPASLRAAPAEAPMLVDSNEGVLAATPLASAAALGPSAPTAAPGPSAPRRPVIAPIAPTRYLLKLTIGQDTHDTLQRVRALLRHSVPDGDLAAIVGRPTRAGGGEARGLEPRRRALRLRRTGRTVRRVRIPRVPPRRSVRCGREDDAAESRVAMSSPQRARGGGSLRRRGGNSARAESDCSGSVEQSMITAELTFSVTSESDVEHIERLLGVWLKNGQIEGRSWLTAFAPGVVRAYVSLATPVALAASNNNVYATERLADLSDRGIDGPDIRIVGVDPDLAWSCECPRHLGLILFTNYTSEVSPVRCAACFDLVPLYTLPHTHDHEHLNVRQWAADYQACDTLQMHCTTGERFAERQLWQHDSALSKQGRSIARDLGAWIGVPVYYFLLKVRGKSLSAERARRCPSCGGAWLLTTPWHKLFDFKCDACGLVSNIASNVK